MRSMSLPRLVGAVVLLAALVGSIQSSQADDWYPGLPPNDGTVADDWTSVAAGGMGYSTLAKQWFKNPAGMTVARSSTVVLQSGTYHQKTRIIAQAYLVSPEGAPGNYGYLEPVTVRSVGFGLLPVEATIQVSQRRKDGYPLPLNVVLDSDNYAEDVGTLVVPSKDVMAPVVVDDAFNVSILKVKIDGEDVGLKAGCHTITPAPVHLVGPGYTVDTPTESQQWFATHDPESYFNPFYGGYMAGNISIPAFTGCKTATGDDISALMTKSASGTENPIKTLSSWPCGGPAVEHGLTKWPIAPGQNTPKKAGCEGVKEFSYPARPAS